MNILYAGSTSYAISRAIVRPSARLTFNKNIRKCTNLVKRAVDQVLSDSFRARRVYITLSLGDLCDAACGMGTDLNRFQVNALGRLLFGYVDELGVGELPEGLTESHVETYTALSTAFADTVWQSAVAFPDIDHYISIQGVTGLYLPYWGKLVDMQRKERLPNVVFSVHCGYEKVYIDSAKLLMELRQMGLERLAASFSNGLKSTVVWNTRCSSCGKWNWLPEDNQDSGVRPLYRQVAFSGFSYCTVCPDKPRLVGLVDVESFLLF